MAYIQGLPDEAKVAAVEYIRRAPEQIETSYRREIALAMPETVTE